jgi:hypothetical protein
MTGLRLGLGLGTGGRPPPAWSPLDLGASLLALFRASSVTASPVATWPDEAPVPHNAIQGSAPARPVLGTLGSSPAVVFNGTNNFVGNSDTLTAASGKLTLALGYQLTALPTGTFGALCDFKTSLGTLDVLVMDIGGYRRLSFIIGSAVMVGADVGYDTNVHRVVLRYKGGTVSTPANWALTVDGVAVTVVASAVAGVGSGTALGSRAGGVSYLAVKMAGAALIDGEADAATIARLDGWLGRITT